MKSICPKCSSNNVVRIVYGYPTPEAIEKAKAGQIALGGCNVDDSNPYWECNSCGHRWKDNSEDKSA